MTLRLVLFDCDGVLVDSERVAAQVAAASLAELGWHLPPAECLARFSGMTLTDILPLVRAQVGQVPDDWVGQLAGRLLAALRDGAVPMEGAAEMLRDTTALGLPWRVASNSNRIEMEAKFLATGLAPLIGDRFHSAGDVTHGKPAPDLFLAAAAAGDTDPADCLVVEDSLPGIRAALAAGMRCVGFAPHGPGLHDPPPHDPGPHDALQSAGIHHLVRHLAELPPLFASLRGDRPT